MDEMFEKRENKKSYTVYWDVSLNIQANKMTWSVILKRKDGAQIVKTHSPRFFEAKADRTKILGSLAYRFKGPVKPRSELNHQPATPRKRGRGGNAPSPRGKSSRLEDRLSPRASESDGEFLPAGSDGDTSGDESRTVLPEEDCYGLAN
jgi:hypothetical protein